MKVIAAYDNNHKAVAAYNLNHDPVAETGDISNWWDLDIPQCNGIIAGPPCQDATALRKLGTYSNKNRTSLYTEVARIAVTKSVDWVVIENVKDIRRSMEFKIAKGILRFAGYYVYECLMNHADYGGLTTRERVFVFASNKPLDIAVADKLKITQRKSQGDYLLPTLYDRQPTGWGATTNVGRLKLPSKHEGITTSTQKGFSSLSYRRWDQPFFTITRSCKGRLFSEHDNNVWQLAPNEICSLAGFDESWMGVTVELAGNAVPPQMARAVGEVIKSSHGNSEIVSLFCGIGGFDSMIREN